MTTAVMLGGCLGGRGSLDGKVVDVANGGAPVPGAILVLTRSRPANWATLLPRLAMSGAPTA